MRARRIVLQSVRIVRWTEVEEGIHVDLVVVTRRSRRARPDLHGWWVEKRNQAVERSCSCRAGRCSLIPLPWILTSARTGVQKRQVLAAIVQRTKIIPAQAQVQIQSRRDLPGVLAEEIRPFTTTLLSASPTLMPEDTTFSCKKVGKREDTIVCGRRKAFVQPVAVACAQRNRLPTVLACRQK